MNELKERFSKADLLRENIIKSSRDILKKSKQAIFSIHRREIERADKLLKQAENIKKQLEGLSEQDPSILTGSFANAIEEYSEAKMLFSAVKESSLPGIDELAVTKEAYLGGLCDFTGELTRMSVMKAIDNDLESVENIRKSVEGILEQLLDFDFRNGELRRKYDSVKYNLQKIENILYEIKILKR